MQQTSTARNQTMRKALLTAIVLSFLSPAMGAAADWQYQRAQDGLQMVQVINENKARVAISRPKLAKKAYYLVFKAPKGTRPLEDCPGKSCPPLRVQVDGKAVHTAKVAPSINYTNVLTFFFPDDSSLLREMKAGHSMTVTFQDGASNKPWVEKFSLMDLTAALAQFEKAQEGN